MLFGKHLECLQKEKSPCIVRDEKRRLRKEEGGETGQEMGVMVLWGCGAATGASFHTNFI